MAVVVSALRAVWSRGRSAYCYNYYYFCFANTGGSAYFSYADYSGAVLAGFAA